MLENSSDRVQSYSEKVQGSQKSKSVLLPKSNDVASYIPVGEETWHKAVIISKAGMSTGRNKFYWHKAVIISKAGKSTGRSKFYLNIKDYDEDCPKCIDWENGVKHGSHQQRIKLLKKKFLSQRRLNQKGIWLQPSLEN